MTASLFKRVLVLILCGMALTACDYHLRGPQTLPFSSIYLNMNRFDDFTAAIKRQIETSGSTRVVDRRADAEVNFQVVRNEKEKSILTLSASGTVREYQLRQRFAFRLVDKHGHEVMPYSEIYVYRDVSFAEGQELAKEQEDALLYRDMQNDILQQMMRRLARARLNTSPGSGAS